MLITLVTLLHLVVCVMLIGIVLLQQGKGADMGATFGGGGGTLFGASGANTFLTRLTTFTAICFMCTSVFLAVHMKAGKFADGSLFRDAPKTAAPEAPVKTEPQKEAPAAPAADAAAKPESAPALPMAPAEQKLPAPQAPVQSQGQP